MSGLTQWHLDNWRDSDFREHIPAVRSTIADLQRQLSEAQTLELEHQATIRHLKAERDEAVRRQKEMDRESFGLRKSYRTEHRRTTAAEADRDRYRRGLETLACTFYKDDQYQDYAKHVLDAARAALQGEPKP
ncbi:hypothetical protein ACHMW4_04350 [Mesorhizobium sp. UC22_110]|uniref:hypothetical protein n=1 Tax=unclassified Mesorhizobium TaxID=325217 RepID=UPI003672AC87